MVYDKDDRSAPGPLRLDERVLSTLQDLQGRIAFSGLRRVLGAHPESLTRSLRRLEREGLVERAAGGYRALTSPQSFGADASNDLRPIAQVELPPGTPPDSVLGRLAGHWFGSLRWIGLVERPSEQLLAWARRDGSGSVLLGIHRGVLRVYVPGGDTAGDLTEAEDAAYELLVHAVDALRPTTSGASRSVSFLRAVGAETNSFTLDN